MEEVIKTLLREPYSPYTAPGAAGPTITNPCFDSSPDFLEDPALLAVTNSEIVYNNLGYDPDLDSLYYDWADPLITWPSTPISWNIGYSSSSPLLPVLVVQEQT